MLVGALGFTLAFHALAPTPPFTAWAAAINKSISTFWITFIRLGEIVIPKSASLA